MKRPFIPLAISLCLGISLSHYLKVPFIYPLILSTAFIILATLYSKKKILSHINLYLALFFLGMAAYQISNTLPDNHISNFTQPLHAGAGFASEDESKVFLRGTIVDDPIVTLTFYKTDKMSFVLNVNYLKEDSGWKKVSGLVKADVYKNKEALGFGDEVILEGL